MGGGGNNPAPVAAPKPVTPTPAAPAKPPAAPGTAGASPAVANFFGQNTATGSPGTVLNTGYGFGGAQPPTALPQPVWGGNPPIRVMPVGPEPFKPIGPAKPVAPIARPVLGWAGGR